MKNSEYWKKRFDQVEQAAHNKSVRYTKQLEKKYARAAQDIDAKINAWYQRLAINNEVSIAEARKLLTASELKEFKWTVEEYIKYGEENAIDQRWMKELENASAKFHINRLEALKLECRQQIEQAMSGGQQTLYGLMADTYKDSFYRSCFEIQKGVTVGFDVAALDDGQVSKLLNKPWAVDDKNFSDRIWSDKKKLINTLDQELSRMVLTGEAPNRAIENIQKSMNTSLSNAKRIVLTEQAYFTTLAQKDAFAELDVEEYEIVATLDSKTSEICQEMDGKHFPLKDMAPGLNAPPFHPYCRTTTCPYFDDEFSNDGIRASRDEEGQTVYEVPANMTYPEWKETFVYGGNKDGLVLATEGNEVVNKITQANIDKVSLKNVPNLSDKEVSVLEAAHKKVLQIAKDDNESMEVALMLDRNMGELSTTLGTVAEIDLNVPGRSKATYVIHNHPNNASFSNKDLAWFMKNDNIKYFSIVKNNGSVELLYKSDEFELERFRTEYKRMVKKYQKDIDNNAQVGYNKAVKDILTKTKSGLVYVR